MRIEPRFKHMLWIYKTIAVYLGTLSSLQATSTERCFEEIILTGNTVNITSPGYPKPYGANLTCGWKIQASAPDRRVGIHIAYISLESSINCQHDSLSFYDGPNSSNGSMFTFCGRDTTPSSFLSSRDSMYIVFISDPLVNAVGFRINVIDYEKCGGTLTATSRTQNLTFPRYPYTYFNNIHCTWIITAENETDTVQLHILRSVIEEFTFGSKVCRHDVLRVYNGNTTEADQYLGQSCSNEVPSYRSSKNSLTVQFNTDIVTTKQDFKLQYTSRTVGDCNATYAVYSSPLIILSPGYPESYESNLECFIMLVDLSHGRLKLDIVDSDLDGAYPDCENDSVTIFQNVRGRRIGEFCGDSSINPVGPYVYSGLIMSVVFKTNGDTSGRGFRIRASHSEVIPPQSEDCGSRFLNATRNRQFLQSPGYPVRYSNNEDCQWTISVSNPNMMVRIEVVDSDLSFISYYNCMYDHVTAYDAAPSKGVEVMYNDCPQEELRPSMLNDTISTWCGPSRPTFQSTGSAVTIHFHTDSVRVGGGFKLAYFETNEPYRCGGTLNITTTYYTNLTSPNYPLPYPNYQECSWTIYAPGNTNIEAKVRNTAIELSAECTFDFLEVFDGARTSSSSAGRVCGADEADYISSGHIITVRFHSDASVRYSGFQMYLKAGHFSVSETEEFSASYRSQYIYSPKYPFNYPRNVTVGWKITADQDYLIKVDVVESRLENSSGCVSDYVEAFDGSDSNAPSLGRWCGKSEPMKRSSGPVMFLQFKSDSSGVDRGFKIKYTKENKLGDCRSRLLNATTDRQFLQSPGYPVRYARNDNCRWTITASTPNMWVRIEVIDSDIYSDDKTYAICPGSYVAAYNGPSIIRYRKIMDWCGPSLPTFQGGSTVTLSFNTDTSSPGRGFKLAYFETTERYHCGATLNITTTDYTTITSPNYPGPYRSPHECVWTINAPANTNIETKMRNTSIDSSSTCTDEFLEIYDGVRTSSPSAGRFCGDADTDYISSGHIITVRFHSGVVSTHKGFQMQLKAGHFRAAETEELSVSYLREYIYSPNYPFNYPSNAEVGWKFTADDDYYVKINGIDFELENSDGCTSDYLEAFDGPDSNATSLGRWCGTSEPNITSSGSVMFLKFKSDSSVVGRGFKIKYTDKMKRHSYSYVEDSNIGAILGGSIGGAFALIFILSAIGFVIYNYRHRTTATNNPTNNTMSATGYINKEALTTKF